MHRPYKINLSAFISTHLSENFYLGFHTSSYSNFILKNGVIFKTPVFDPARVAPYLPGIPPPPDRQVFAIARYRKYN